MMNSWGDDLKKERLGDFEIIRELGRGGMGIVYEARQISLNRKVALKVLSSGLGMTTKAVIRFRREAETAAKLHHTNIVPVHATGEEDGTHYYAMELVDGPSLNFVIRNMRDQSRSGQPEVQAQRTPPSVSDSTVAVSPKPVTPDASLEDTAGALPDWVAKTMSMEAGSESSASGTSVGESSSVANTRSGSLSARWSAARSIGSDAGPSPFAPSPEPSGCSFRTPLRRSRSRHTLVAMR